MGFNELNSVEHYTITVCQCFSSDELNCMFSTLCQARQDLVYPFSIDIPEGYLLINSNFGVDFIDNGSTNPDDFHTAFWVSNTFAKPNCVTQIVENTTLSPIDMDLNNWM